VIEVIVSCDHWQIMLPCQGSNPDIVLRNRTAHLPQLFSQHRIVRGRFDFDRKHNGVMNQEIEQTAQAASFARSGKTVSVLSDDDHRKMMPVFSLQSLGDRPITAEEGRKSIRVENHRHSDGSIRSRSVSMN
jgi:hypothetical protein